MSALFPVKENSPTSNDRGSPGSFRRKARDRFLSRVASSPYGKRLARGVFWNLAGNLVSRGATLLASIIVARIIGKIGFGELGIVQSTIGMFGAFAGLGLGLTATKYIAEFRDTCPDRASRIIALTHVLAVIAGGLIALLLYACAPWLAARTLAAPHLSPILRIGAGLLFFSAVNGALTGVLSGFEDFRSIARVNLVAGAASFVFVVAGARWAGLIGALWGSTAAAAFNLILNAAAVKRAAKRARVPLLFSGWKRELRILWNFSFPALLNGIVVVPATWGANAILVNGPSGYAEMGAFNAANQWFLALMFLPAILIQVILPILSERFGRYDSVQSGRLIVLSLKINAVLVFPLVILGSVLSPFLMSLNGPGFRNAWPTLIAVLGTAGLVALQWPAYTVLQAAGRMWVAFAMSLAWAVIFLVGAVFLTRYGALGLALSRAVAYVCHTAWTFAYLWHFRRTAGGQDNGAGMAPPNRAAAA
jgi:O-antigen/teichoic acid export membrane protein